MNKLVSVSLLGAALTTASFAQVSGTFDFSGSLSGSSQDFSTNNGFSMLVSGLFSKTALNENHTHVTLNSTAFDLASAHDGGIGTGPFSDGELRNGAGTPSLSGASILELSDLKGPNNAKVTDLDILLSSVDTATHEGFLVYGSTGNAALSGSAHLTLLDHGFGNSKDIGSFDVNSSLLSKYSTFYVTADNGHYSSVALGNGTKATAAPEPLSIAGFAIAGLPLLRRRRKKA